MVYLMTIVVAILILFLAHKPQNKKIKKLLYFLSFIVILVPHGFRYGIGTDYFYIYVPYFNFIGTGERFFSEWLFNIINITIYKTFYDYRMLFFVCSLISLGFIFKGILENSPKKTASVFMIFLCQYYFYSMNMVRQAIAISMIFYAYKFLKNGKNLMYIIFCIFAMSFHFSAIIMIPLGLLAEIKWKKTVKIFLIVFLFAIAPQLSQFFYILINEFTRYGYYFNSRYDTGDVSLLLVVVNTILFIITLFYDEKNKGKKDGFYILCNFNFYAIILLLFSPYIPLISRFMKYLTVFQILLVGQLLDIEKNKTKSRVLGGALLTMFFVVMVYQIFYLGGEGAYPYKSIFKI